MYFTQRELLFSLLYTLLYMQSFNNNIKYNITLVFYIDILDLQMLKCSRTGEYVYTVLLQELCISFSFRSYKLSRNKR